MATKATSRKRVWLRVKGHTNTLSQQFVRAGYRPGYETTVAKKHKCKASELPLGVLSKYLGGRVEKVDPPKNWREIMYGERKKKSKDQLVKEFLSMRLSRNPVPVPGYY